MMVAQQSFPLAAGGGCPSGARSGGSHRQDRADNQLVRSNDATSGLEELTMSATEIPVQHLFTLTLKDVRTDRQDFVGPFGRRSFERPRGGTFTGARVKGQVLDLLATDYGNASVDGSIRHTRSMR
jgi:hypothetical protein